MRKNVIILFFYTLVLLAIPLFFYLIKPEVVETLSPPIQTKKIITPTPYIFSNYNQYKVPQKDVYKIAMIGDSMTAALGPHGGGMSEFMNEKYKSSATTQRIIIDNYAVSSNILSVGEQIDKRVTRSEYIFGPLIAESYDVILIESFGYNPLSEFGIDEGIKKQNEALDSLMTKLTQEKSSSVIIFITTIAPNIATFGASTQKTNTLEDRKKQAEERVAYLKNHNEYAKKHNIPLLNIYEKTLTENGDGNTKYINPTDDIHPSVLGITFIGEEIGNYIYDNNILIP